MIRFAENLNKMITAGLGGAMEAPSTEVAVGHRVIYKEASGAVATFETNASAPLRSLRVDMQPIQEGSGDPSPDNIRPITGRTEVTVERTGKNLFPNTIWEENPAASKPVTWEVSGDTIKLGKNSATTGIMTAGFNCNLVENQTYTLSVESIVLNASDVVTAKPTLVVFYDDGTNQNLGANWTFAPTKVVKHFRLSIGITNVSWQYVTIKGLQLELGSTATDYEPYDGQSVTVQLGQTVYGGTVDVITGKATIAWKKYIGSAFANASARTGGYYARMLLGGETYAGGQIAPARYACNAAVKLQNRYDKWYYNAAGSLGGTVNYVHMYIPEDAIDYHEGDNITTLLNAAYNASNFEFVLPLAEPFDIDITLAQLSTLRGDNNVWSDAGNISLEYPYYEETEGY